jgi:hypothetical protein
MPNKFEFYQVPIDIILNNTIAVEWASFTLSHNFLSARPCLY